MLVAYLVNWQETGGCYSAFFCNIPYYIPFSGVYQAFFAALYTLLLDKARAGYYNAKSLFER